MDNRNNLLKEFQDKIGLNFSDNYYFETALTHSSYAKQKKGTKYNERLEFLGDSVLSLAVTEYIFLIYKNKKEGELTKLRALVVCENSLYQVAVKLNLGKYILMSKGEEITGGRNRVSILADCMEALIAAIYIDLGFETAKKFIMDNFMETIKSSANNCITLDYKTKLQELIQRNKNQDIKYELIKYDGPPHNRKFYVNVIINEKVLGQGIGLSKKEAEKKAAKEALLRYENGE
ncbi:MAG: ribonuclease III [Clostridiaceae bacterium]